MRLRLDLDAFGDERRAAALADRVEAGDDLALDRIGVDVAHERVGDLDVVGLQVQDRLEAGVSRAGVVDGDLHVRPAHELEHLLERVVVAHHLLLGDLDDDVAVAAVDGGEVALVQEHRVAQQHRRGVHEEAALADRARQVREDRLEAQRLELDVHLVLVRHGEEDGGRLERGALRAPDQGLVAHDRAVGQLADGLERRAQLLLSDDGLQAGEELELLVRLPLADDLDGLLRACG